MSFKKRYAIMVNDVDYNGEIFLTRYIDYLQNTSNLHSEAVGDNIDELTKAGKAWVILSWEVNIHRYVKFLESIEIETEGISADGLLASRKFVVYDEDGEIVLDAVMTCMLLDLNKRKVARIPNEFYELYSIPKKKVNRLVIDKIEDVTCEEKVSLKYTDFDSNKHVNNCAYIRWAQDMLPLELYKQNKIKKLEIIYQKEITEEYKPIIRLEKREKEVIYEVMKNDEISSKIKFEI